MSLTLEEGTLFAGRYRLGRVIGVGGMGAVYEAVHLETNRRRALKVMHPTLFESPDLRERFQREAKIAAEIESEFIVEVFDAGVDDKTRMPFLVMELLRGEDLDHRVERLGRLPPTEAVTYLHQVALALDKTHRASIVHRDLKPENIFVTQREDGLPRVKVLDFGIAKLLAERSSIGRATHGVGTPLYMAPEQFDGAAVSGATDVYALGMVAYTLLVGASYWAKEEKTGNLLALLNAASRGKPEPASARAAEQGVTLPPAFDAWFDKATALQPGARFQVASAAVRALAEVMEIAPPPSAGRMPAWLADLATGATVASVPAGTPIQAPSPSSSRRDTDNTPLPPGGSRGEPAASPRPRVGRVAGLSLALGVGGLLGAVVYAMQAGRGQVPAAGDAPGAGARATAVELQPMPGVTPSIAPMGAASAAEATAPAASDAASAAPAASSAASAASSAASAAPAASSAASAAPSAQPSPSGPAPTKKKRWTRD
ncbi:protein kinase [Sorangium cellulosum]|uniref:Protein kinase n=1 Tax=Sorangium cellulosum TaxID=56 RepID=A0A2L0F0U3_SORCE|nr:serine/threonine-protein kinase [Sorangium cellulosum]AUX45121.1 protein kinase [Sorangium cellulosum]